MYVLKTEGGKTTMEMKTRLSNICYSNNKKVTDCLMNGYWLGKRCFILGGGESLKNFDFDRLKGEKTIGINRAFEKYPVDILFAMDYLFYRRVVGGSLDIFEEYSVRERWSKFKGVKVMLTPMSAPSMDPGVCVIRRIFEPRVSLDLNAGIYGGTNSGIGALMLAIILGANPIYLLGFDMKAKRNTHWHSGYPNQTLEGMNARLEEYKKDFEVVAPMIKEKGVRVVNLYSRSALKCFEMSSVKEVLG